MVRVKTGLGEVLRYQGRLWEGGRKPELKRIKSCLQELSKWLKSSLG